MIRCFRSFALILTGLVCLLGSGHAAAMYDPGAGRFLQRDPSGYPDGLNSYGAYHVQRGGVDPSGNVVVFVHGISTTNSSDITDNIYPQLMNSWGGGDSQALIRFIYTTDGQVPGKIDALWGETSGTNKAAGIALAKFLDDLHAQREEIKEKYGEDCYEPIHLVTYSNGSYPGFFALERINAETKVDSWTIIGASLDDGWGGVDITHVLENKVGTVNNFWSEYDGITDAPGVDGIGSDGLIERNRNLENVNDHEIPYVHHSPNDINAGRNPGLDSSNVMRMPGNERHWLRGGGNYPSATMWMTRFMAHNYYAAPTSNMGDLSLSKNGQVPFGGPALQPNSTFYHHVDFKRTDLGGGQLGNPTITTGRDP